MDEQTEGRWVLRSLCDVSLYFYNNCIAVFYLQKKTLDPIGREQVTRMEATVVYTFARRVASSAIIVDTEFHERLAFHLRQLLGLTCPQKLPLNWLFNCKM